MKKLIMITLSVMGITSVQAGDFDNSAHEVTVESDNITVTYERTIDTNHKTEIGYKGFDLVDVALSRVNQDDTETTLKVSGKPQNVLGMNFVPTTEYRTFETAQDHLHFNVNLSHHYNVTTQMDVYGSVEPQFSYNKNGDDKFNFDTTEAVLGGVYKVTSKVSFDVYAKHHMDSSFDKTELSYGTILTYKM